MNEFDLIAMIQSRAPRGTGVVAGIGDDAAVLQPSTGMHLIATTDNLVAGRHFIDSGATRAQADEIGHLALAVNLSDLAAMGAVPRWCLLSLTLPQADDAWLDGFLDGFLALAGSYDTALVGGNLARGALNIGVTALGEVESGRAMTRQGAHAGDRIVVTGMLGDAAAALADDVSETDYFRRRLLRPEPRIAAGRVLAVRARAMIDVSDGLLADLGHLLSPGLGARLELEQLPASPALARAAPDRRRRAALQCAGGDYELLATLPPESEVPNAVGETPICEIGKITETGRTELVFADGTRLAPNPAGWDHFR